MSPPPQLTRENLIKYAHDEHVSKQGADLPFELTAVFVPSPRQGNGCDCGVFACMFGLYAANDKKVDFSQDDMPRCSAFFFFSNFSFIFY
jgi:Ulp1 family protease